MRRFRRALTKAVLTTLLVGSTAGWASESSESTLNGPLPGTAAWLADDSLGKDLPDPNTTTPSEVAAFFADLTDTQQQRLVEDHRAGHGRLDPGADGLDATLRGAARGDREVRPAP